MKNKIAVIKPKICHRNSITDWNYFKISQ